MEFQVPHLDDVPLLVKAQLVAAFVAHLLVHAFGVHVQGVDIDRGPGGLVDGEHRPGVIVVAVGDEDGLGLQVVVVDIVQDGAGFRAGVDDGAAQGLFVGHHIAVGAQLPYGETFDQHSASSLRRIAARTGGCDLFLYSVSVSRIRVTGPSFTEATCISAPNSPVWAG